MLKASTVLLLAFFASPALAQSVPPATDLSASDIKAFIDKLPRNAVTDSAIRVVDVGGYKLGVYGVFRPRTQPGDAVRHETKVTEVYYILDGGGTLVRRSDRGAMR